VAGVSLGVIGVAGVAHLALIIKQQHYPTPFANRTTSKTTGGRARATRMRLVSSLATIQKKKIGQYLKQVPEELQRPNKKINGKF
jgi:hypothetical protein